MTYQQSGVIGLGEGQPKKSLNRRSHLEIRMDMLRAVIDGAEGPTQIMYRANLSWMLLCDHLKALEGMGFLAETAGGNRRKYSLTEKGLAVVKAYDEVIKELEVSTRVPEANPYGY